MTTGTQRRPPETAIQKRVTPCGSGAKNPTSAPEDWHEPYRFGLPTEWVMAAQILTGSILVFVALSGDRALLVFALAFLGFGLTAPFRLADRPNMIIVSGIGNLEFRLPFEQLVLPVPAIETLTR